MALSYHRTGKYTSERHAGALKKGMKTAGEAAKAITKNTGVKVSAKQIRGFADEWHHSGFYSEGMGKTWFFSEKTIDFLIDKYSTLKRTI